MNTLVVPKRVSSEYKLSTIYMSLQYIAKKQYMKVSREIDATHDAVQKDKLARAFAVITDYRNQLSRISKESAQTTPSLDVFNTKLLLGVEAYLECDCEKLASTSTEATNALDGIVADFFNTYVVFREKGGVPFSLIE